MLALYVAGLSGTVLLAWWLLAPLVTQAATLVDELPRDMTPVRSVVDRWQIVVLENPEAERALRAIPSQANAFFARALAVFTL